jgi:FixJ family two-component response regulator
MPSDASGCLILDLSMPGHDGLALQREISSRGSGLSVIFVAGNGDIPKSVQAMKNGAADCLTKPVDGGVFLDAVRRVLELERIGRRAREERAAVEKRLAHLTPREREVLEGVVLGKLNKQVARDLGITEKTVKVHRGRVMEKMQVSSFAELVRQINRAVGLESPLTPTLFGKEPV